MSSVLDKQLFVFFSKDGKTQDLKIIDLDEVKVLVKFLEEGYDPELPVLKSAVLHIFTELLLHMVDSVPPHGHTCCRQLLLTQAVVGQRQKQI